MTLEETTQLYASVLRQLLPVGGYDTSPNTEALAVDVYAHAKLLAQADLDGKRLLSVLEGFPPDLINEYETEYGLPLKCTVNASRTFEERLQILNWVRTSRNVLNRAYLEQLLAIFGVVLIDVMKFRPMLCTAVCDSAVNTEQLRYKVFLRLQYPVNADMGCIIHNYLPGYLRIDWMIDMPWGDWIINPVVTVNNSGIAHYTAYKTNQREYYDSYADLDLTDAIVRSLHDSDMQQWQAVIDVCNELSGTNNWFFDLDNNLLKYVTGINPDTYQYIYSANNSINDLRYRCYDPVSCQVAMNKYTPGLPNLNCVYSDGTSSNIYCWYKFSGSNPDYYNLVRGLNPNYDPNAVAPTSNIPLAVIAQKIISNTQNPNQAISLLAEAYLEAVASSIFNTDPSKQFVKLSDLLSQFESNKVLRT